MFTNHVLLEVVTLFEHESTHVARKARSRRLLAVTDLDVTQETGAETEALATQITTPALDLLMRVQVTLIVGSVMKALAAESAAVLVAGGVGVLVEHVVAQFGAGFHLTLTDRAAEASGVQQRHVTLQVGVQQHGGALLAAHVRPLMLNLPVTRQAAAKLALELTELLTALVKAVAILSRAG